MPDHVTLPAAMLALALLVVGASVRYRLPERLWTASSSLGLIAPLIPAVSQHYVSDRLDLAVLMSVPGVTFAANMFASRTRVAQLPLNWARTVDEELGRLIAAKGT